MDYGIETIKRQIRVAYGWLVVGQSVGAGLAYAYRLYASSVCDMNSAAAVAVCSLWHYIQMLYAFAYAPVPVSLSLSLSLCQTFMQYCSP